LSPPSHPVGQHLWDDYCVAPLFVVDFTHRAILSVTRQDLISHRPRSPEYVRTTGVVDFRYSSNNRYLVSRHRGSLLQFAVSFASWGENHRDTGYQARYYLQNRPLYLSHTIERSKLVDCPSTVLPAIRILKLHSISIVGPPLHGEFDPGQSLYRRTSCYAIGKVLRVI
jgi:hypothetical protein